MKWFRLFDYYPPMPDTATTRETAPWPDFLGKPIYEGDRVCDNTGDVGIVVTRKHISNPKRRWWVRLENREGFANLRYSLPDCYQLTKIE